MANASGRQTLRRTAASIREYDIKSTNRLGHLLEIPENVSAVPSRRSCKKLIRFRPDELATVNDRARSLGQPVAVYIREASLGARRRAIAGTLSAPVIRDLASVATRLRSLHETANALGLSEAEDFGKAVEEILDLIRRMD